MKLSGKLTAIAVLVILLITGTALVQNGDLFFQIKKQITIFNDVFREVSTQYVDEVEPQKLVNSAIQSMLETLDPYTVFIDEGEQQQMEILSSGSYGGIGIEAGYRGDEVVIIAPMDGYPADRAGLRAGDVLLEINGVSIQDLSPEEIQQLTIGDVGTEMTIVIRRRGITDPISFTLVRERIEVKNIHYADRIGENDKFGYIHLARFGQQASEEIRSELIRLDEESKLEGLVLDLRNNPGGLLNEAVELVDLFVEPGVTVVETRGRYDHQNTVWSTEEAALFEDLPIIVLINEGSASASEVVAGAFQDLDRAVILGENSFGKGLVQTIRQLSYNTSLKITVSRYYIPSGRSIQAIDHSSHSQADEISDTPDSLRRVFQTKNGRVVMDGRGVEPDIQFEGVESSLIDIELQRNNQYLFFINDLITERGIDPDEEAQQIPNRIFQQFASFLIEENFNYETPVDNHLKEIESNIENFSSKQRANENIDELRALLRDYKISQIYENQDHIEQNLLREWISQSYPESEKNRALLKLDEWVLEAVEIMNNEYRYMTLLRP